MVDVATAVAVVAVDVGAVGATVRMPWSGLVTSEMGLPASFVC